METPVNYCLLEQTVTVYRLTEGAVQRHVYGGAYLQTQTDLTWDEQGHLQERKFLLVLPEAEAELSPGDRVIEGVGPEVTPEQWSSFLPVSVPGLCQIRYVKPYYWQGRLSHWEAGR